MSVLVVDVVSLPFRSCFFSSSAFSDCRRHIDDNNAFCKTLKNTVFAKMLYLEDYLESEYIRDLIFCGCKRGFIWVSGSCFGDKGAQLLAC